MRDPPARSPRVATASNALDDAEPRLEMRAPLPDATMIALPDWEEDAALRELALACVAAQCAAIAEPPFAAGSERVAEEAVSPAALEALLTRTRRFERVDDEPLPLHPSPVFRAVTSLPLRLEPV